MEVHFSSFISQPSPLIICSNSERCIKCCKIKVDEQERKIRRGKQCEIKIYILCQYKKYLNIKNPSLPCGLLPPTMHHTYALCCHQTSPPSGIPVLCLVAQLCGTLCNFMDCSPPGSPVHGNLQTRMLEWVTMPPSRGSSQPRDKTQVSHIVGIVFTI